MNKIIKCWMNKKDIVKDTIIVVAVPLVLVCLHHINWTNKIIEKHDIKDLFDRENKRNKD